MDQTFEILENTTLQYKIYMCALSDDIQTHNFTKKPCIITSYFTKMWVIIITLNKCTDCKSVAQ